MPVIKVTDRLDEIAETDWNRLVDDGSFFLSHRWLRYVESERTELPRYALAVADGTIQGALPLYQVRKAYRALYRGGHFRELLGFTGEALLAGACRGFRSTLLTVPRPAGALTALIEWARREAARDGYAGIVLPFLTTPALRAVARVARVRAAFDMAEAEMVGVSGGLDAYAERASRRVRGKLRSDQARFAAAGWTIRQRDLGDCWPEAARLLDNLQRKYQHTDKTVADHERVIAGQVRHLGADSVTFTCEDDAGIAGLAVFYRWRAALFGGFAGFDYDRLRDGREYFNVTVCAPLEYAGRAGIERLHLGVASWEAKGYRGAVLRPLWSGFIPAGPGGPPGVELLNAGTARRQAADIARRGIAICPADWDITSPL